MHTLANKITLFFLYIFIISITLFHISSASDSQCSPLKNLKWNKNKQKCVECPSCPPGYFRNLTEPYTKRTGKHGAERCIRCRPCPEGRYSRNGYGVCSRCVVNCTELYREFAEPCTKFRDAKCGSCLNGFYDMFRNTQFPCAPKRQERILKRPKKPSSKPQELSNEDLKPPAGSQSEVEGSSKEEADSEINDTTGVQSSKSFLKNHPTELSNFAIEMIVVGVAVFVLVLSLVGFAVFKMHTRTRRTKRLVGNVFNTQGTGTYTTVNHLSCDNDIEMDTFAHSDETGTIHHNPIPQTEPAAVRSELQPSVQQNQPSQARAELSHLPTTDNLEGMIYIQLSGGSSEVFCYEKHKDICRCRIDKWCHCKSYDFSEDICIEKSDKYVLEVAANICHDPFALFYNLGLESPTIYQENDSRDRDPVKISQKELVINLLHRWIEVKPTRPTLKQLSIALCIADFHNINSKLYDL